MYKMLPIWCLMGWLYTCMLTNFSSTENVDLSGLNYTSQILNTHFKGSKFVRAQQYHMNRNQTLTKNSLISSSSVPSTLPPPTSPSSSQMRYHTLQPEGLNTKLHFYSKEHWYTLQSGTPSTAERRQTNAIQSHNHD